METQKLAESLAAAATILTGDASAHGPSLDLLAELQYLDGAHDAAPHRSALLRAACKFQRIFSIPAEDAPGLVVLGAELDAGCIGLRDTPTGGVSGTGLNFRQAFESCVGEGVEYISQFAAPDDRFVSLTDNEALRDATPALQALWDRLLPFRRNPDAERPDAERPDAERPDAGRTDWTLAANLADGTAVHLPADLCFRRPADVRNFDPPWPLSTGCGAAADPLDATLHGLLELIERDAVALWLRGGVRPRVIPPAPGAGLLGQLRGAAPKRRTWLLDITSDIGVPVVAAVACDDTGFGLCRGSACRPTLAAAADAALMELAQMEVAYRISATKQAMRGAEALNNTDREHILRYTAIDVGTTAALHPLAPPAPSCDLLAHDKIAILAGVRKRLEAAGVEVYALNLTRPKLGIAVVRTIAPGLEVGLTSPPGPRLRSAAEEAGIDLTRPILL